MLALMTKRTRLVLVGVGFAVLLVSCGQPTAILAPTPTDIPIAKIPIAQSYASGGLGMTRAAWEAQHGSPSEGDSASGLANYEQNKYLVTFWFDTVMNIIRQAPNGTVQSLVQRQQEARAMLPGDATLIETHRETPVGGGGSDDVVEVYTSSSLIARYPADTKVGDFPWWDGGPGSIGIIYYGDGNGWILGAGYSK